MNFSLWILFVLDYLLLEITTPLIVYICRRHGGTCKVGFEFYLRIECILLKFHWGMKALTEVHYRASLKMYFGQRFHTPMKLQKNTFNSYLHLANPRTFSLRELNYRDGRRQVNNSRRKPVCFAQRRWYFENYWWPGRGGNPHHVVSSKLPLRNNVVYKSVNTIQY